MSAGITNAIAEPTRLQLWVSAVLLVLVSPCHLLTMLLTPHCPLTGNPLYLPHYSLEAVSDDSSVARNR